MLSLLCEGSQSFLAQNWPILAIIGILIIFMVFGSIRRKKYDSQVQDLLSNIKIGDKVKTYSGFYGTVVSIRETTDGKVVLIEMGEGAKKGYVEMDINAIMCLDKKTDVVYDSNGNVVMPETETAEEKAEEHVSVADKLREKKAKKQEEKDTKQEEEKQQETNEDKEEDKQTEENK